MSTFSSLFQSGTAFYGDPFGPIIDLVTDFGWSLLPQFPGSVGGGTGSTAFPQPQGPQPVSLPPVSVEESYPGGWIESETTWVRPVLSRSTGPGIPAVPREIVVVEGVSTEVERHPEGDFPSGSIFAPGQAWEPTYDARPEEEEVGLGDAFDWVLDTLTGQQEWQVFGPTGPPAGPSFYGAGVPNVPMVPPPSGIPGRPTTITGYTPRGIAMTGDNCGNRRYVTLDRETGKITCKRRRRRRLLTNRDLADLASLKTITGGGAALNAAVIRAVR